MLADDQINFNFLHGHRYLLMVVVCKTLLSIVNTLVYSTDQQFLSMESNLSFFKFVYYIKDTDIFEYGVTGRVVMPFLFLR